MASDSFPVRARTIFVGAQIAGCYFGNTCNACAVSGARRQSFQPLPFSQNWRGGKNAEISEEMKSPW